MSAEREGEVKLGPEKKKSSREKRRDDIPVLIFDAAAMSSPKKIKTLGITV